MDELKSAIITLHEKYRRKTLFLAVTLTILVIVSQLFPLILPLDGGATVPMLILAMPFGLISAGIYYKWYSIKDASRDPFYAVLFKYPDNIKLIYTAYPLTNTGLLETIQGYSIMILTKGRNIVGFPIKSRKDAIHLMELLKKNFPDKEYADSEKKLLDYLRNIES